MTASHWGSWGGVGEILPLFKCQNKAALLCDASTHTWGPGLGPDIFSMSRKGSLGYIGGNIWVWWIRKMLWHSHCLYIYWHHSDLTSLHSSLISSAASPTPSPGHHELCVDGRPGGLAISMSFTHGSLFRMWEAFPLLSAFVPQQKQTIGTVLFYKEVPSGLSTVWRPPSDQNFPWDSLFHLYVCTPTGQWARRQGERRLDSYGVSEQRRACQRRGKTWGGPRADLGREALWKLPPHIGGPGCDSISEPKLSVFLEVTWPR